MRVWLLLPFIIFLSCESKKIVKIDGSSTVYPITEKVVDHFIHSSDKDPRVTIGVSGTGAGFKKFIRNEIDIAQASRPIKKSEAEKLEAKSISYIELPVAFDGLAVVVHPDNKWVDYITVEELKKIWEPDAQDKIKKWNQIRPEWPDRKIILYGAGTQSGTFDYFTEAIVGEAKASRGDYTASEDDNVLVQGISTDPNALGYFGYDYYHANKDKLKLVPIDDQDDQNGKGAIAPSPQTIIDGTYQPLSRPLLVYINKESSQGKEVDLFVNYFLENASELVPLSGYVALPGNVYDLVRTRYKKRIPGSLFLKLETTVGVDLVELLKTQETN